ncbi:Protein of unknown function [Bacillus cereus]
MEEVK